VFRRDLRDSEPVIAAPKKREYEEADVVVVPWSVWWVGSSDPVKRQIVRMLWDGSVLSETDGLVQKGPDQSFLVPFQDGKDPLLAEHRLQARQVADAGACQKAAEAALQEEVAS
jgi:hypothetical protein